MEAATLTERYYAQGYWRHDTLWDTLSRVALARPEAIAFIDGDRSISYGALLAEAGRFAGALRAQGIHPGEAVIIHGRNALETVIALLGCWRQGYVAIPVPPMFSAAQLVAIIGNAQARVMINCTGSDALEQAASAASACALPCLVTMALRDGAIGWNDFLASGNAAPAAAPAGADALAMLIYSSGTTGAPKGVMHSSNTIRYTAEQIARLHEIGPQDTVMVACQFGFIGSAAFGLLLTLVSGATGVLVGRWSAELGLELIERHRVSYSLFMPTHVIDLLAAPALRSTDCSSFRRGILAGITAQQREMAAQLLCAQPYAMFGMSECAGQTTGAPGDAPDKRAQTDGHTLPGADTIIVDDQDRPLPAGSCGNVLVRGPSRCLGYYGAPELTGAAISKDGYFRTGDLGVVDAEGYFTFASRARDVLRRGGVTIVPAEIEDSLRKNPQVREAAIIGLPDARLGERACACVIAASGHQPTLESLNAGLERDGVAQYLWPEVLILFEDMPRTASLKVKKAELRTMVLAQMAAGDNAAA
ncbi:MAG: AMP-binding protein [Pseudomonadota bacterium]